MIEAGREPASPDAEAVKVKDPFPSLTYARKYLWGFFDHNAFRRLMRIGVPSPWYAYQIGYRDAVREMELSALRKKGTT